MGHDLKTLIGLSFWSPLSVLNLGKSGGPWPPGPPSSAGPVLYLCFKQCSCGSIHFFLLFHLHRIFFYSTLAGKLNQIKLTNIDVTDAEFLQCNSDCYKPKLVYLFVCAQKNFFFRTIVQNEVLFFLNWFCVKTDATSDI